jgi:hypothetical protein
MNTRLCRVFGWTRRPVSYFIVWGRHEGGPTCLDIARAAAGGSGSIDGLKIVPSHE